jgi:hypothetical protein
MSKKLITACLGLVAFAAFALPAAASAANKPVITHPTGTPMTTRATTCTTVGEAGCLTGTNLGTTKLKNGEGTTTLVECNTAKLTGSLTKNSAGTIEGDISTATFFGGGAAYSGMEECKGVSIFPNLTVTTNGTDPEKTFLEGTEDVESGTPYCLKSTPEMAEDEFQLRGGTCSDPVAKKITFIFDTTAFFPGEPNRECKYERPATEPIKGTFTTHPEDAIFSVLPGPNTKFKGEAGNNILCPASGTLEMKFTMETDSVAASPVYISKLP